MSRLGRICYQERSGPGFLGNSGSDSDRSYSEQTAREIDLEVHKILDVATEAVREILLARRDALEAIAQRLMEKEVIDGSELRQLLEQYNPGPRLVPCSDALPPGPLAEGKPADTEEVASLPTPGKVQQG